MMTRKDAIAANVSQYFTGNPCKYGHISYRYTQSGSCAECVSLAAKMSRAESLATLPRAREKWAIERQAKYDELVAKKNERANALAGLVRIKLSIHVQDLQTVFDTAIGMCLAEFPCLDVADVRPSIQPVKGGIPVYSVLVPPKHVGLVRQVAETLWIAHGIDIAAERARIIGQVARMAEDEADEPPEGHM